MVQQQQQIFQFELSDVANTNTKLQQKVDKLSTATEWVAMLEKRVESLREENQALVMKKEKYSELIGLGPLLNLGPLGEFQSSQNTSNNLTGPGPHGPHALTHSSLLKVVPISLLANLVPPGPP